MWSLIQSVLGNSGITPWYPQPHSAFLGNGGVTVFTKKLIHESFHTIRTMLDIFLRKSCIPINWTTLTARTTVWGEGLTQSDQGTRGPMRVLPSSGACWPTWWMSSSALGPVHLWGNKEKALAQRYLATCSPALPTPSFSRTVEAVSSAWDSALLLGRLSLSGFPLLSLYTLDRITCLKNHVSAKSPSHPNSPGRAVIPCTPTTPPASSKNPKLWKPPTGGAEWSRPSGTAEVTFHSPHTGPLDQCSPPSPSSPRAPSLQLPPSLANQTLKAAH